MLVNLSVLKLFAERLKEVNADILYYGNLCTFYPQLDKEKHKV